MTRDLVADFHSLRHTFISNLARGGVHPKVAQSLARHSTITLTMDRYSHTLVGEHADALAVLPDLSATGRQAVGRLERKTLRAVKETWRPAWHFRSDLQGLR